jgi:signal peptidase II
VRALRGGHRPPVKRNLPLLLLMAAVVLLDQGSKAIVVRTLGLHESVPLVDGLLSLSHVRNRGAAFGLLSDWDLPYQSALLSVLSVAALVAIALYFLRLPSSARLPRLALALVLGGAVGNLIDRVRLGYVVDFVHAFWRQHQWPDFNLADSAITVGVTLLVLDILRSPGPAPAGARAGMDAATPNAGRTD